MALISRIHGSKFGQDCSQLRFFTVLLRPCLTFSSSSHAVTFHLHHVHSWYCGHRDRAGAPVILRSSWSFSATRRTSKNRFKFTVHRTSYHSTLFWDTKCRTLSHKRTRLGTESRDGIHNHTRTQTQPHTSPQVPKQFDPSPTKNHNKRAELQITGKYLDNLYYANKK